MEILVGLIAGISLVSATVTATCADRFTKNAVHVLGLAQGTTFMIPFVYLLN